VRDFTITALRDILLVLKNKGYCFVTFEEFLKAQGNRTVILRHDVDRSPFNSLIVARVEHELGLKGSYYFRAVPESMDISVIRQIYSLGHEIGYHYEDMALVGKGYKTRKSATGLDTEEKIASKAFKSFNYNLERLREIAPVKTICMHGSPLSKWDSRLIWKYNDFRESGITGEPYFDVDFRSLLYLTDTGRRWNGRSVSVRDKGSAYYRNEPINEIINFNRFSGWKVKPVIGSALDYTAESELMQSHYDFRSTKDIILAAERDELPGKIMITCHPQRWNDNKISWMKEFVGQNLRNTVKYFIVIRNSGKL